MSIVDHQAWIPVWLQPAPDSMVCRVRRSGRRPGFQVLNLLWSAWVFVTPLFMPVGWHFYVSLALSYPLFLLLFVLSYVRPNREAWYYVTALDLLAVACMPFNPAAWSYGVFACAFVPYSEKDTLVISAAKLAFVELLLVLPAVWMRWPWEIVAVLIGVCTSTGCGSLAARITSVKNAAQRMSVEEVRRLAANAERERIGRDLHDLLGHTLSLITLKLELSRKLFDRDPGGARRELGEAEDVARHALAEVRAAVTGIRATGLAGEMASARLMLRASGVELAAGAMPILPDAVDDVLALVLREAVTNIHRHAQARHAEVDVRLVGNHAVMHVRDDGRGGVRASGNGLHGMRERVEALGGTLGIESRPGKGTRLRVDVPLPVSATEAGAGKAKTAVSVPALMAGKTTETHA